MESNTQIGRKQEVEYFSVKIISQYSHLYEQHGSEDSRNIQKKGQHRKQVSPLVSCKETAACIILLKFGKHKHVEY